MIEQQMIEDLFQHDGWVHHLKTDPEPFAALKRGEKTVEIRKNDRGFKTGDFLVLEEIDHAKKFTGRALGYKITHILIGGIYGLHMSYAALSIKRVFLLRFWNPFVNRETVLIFG